MMDLVSVERRVTVLVSLLTLLTGLAQLAIPARLLPLLQVEPTAVSAHLFATVGMFMVLFGGAVLHALRREPALPVVLFWAGLQKLGASLLVALAVYRNLFAPLALWVVALDFASGLLFLDLRRRGEP
jgi:hypothetical protein